MTKPKSEAVQVKRAEMNHALEMEKIHARGRMQLYDKLFKLGRQAITGGVLVFIAYFIYRSVDAIAGKTTKFDALISWLSDVKMNQWAAWLLASITGGGWYRERRLRRTTIKEQAGHITELEKRVGPERTSSGLHADGRPKQKDLDNA